MVRYRSLEEKELLVKEQVGISEELLEEQLTNRFNHLNLLREENELGSRIEEDRAQLKQANQALKAAQGEYESYKNSFIAETSQELDEAKQNLAELNERMSKFQDSLERTTLVSPVDGTVKKIYVHTEGGVIQPGETVLDIVPKEDLLIIESKLPIEDIGYVELGQTAYLRLASADAARFDKLEGTLIHVSPDAEEDESGESYYMVKVEATSNAFENRGERYQLYPGMKVTASIITGNRTVLTYLIDPFISQMHGAMGER